MNIVEIEFRPDAKTINHRKTRKGQETENHHWSSTLFDDYHFSRENINLNSGLAGNTMPLTESHDWAVSAADMRECLITVELPCRTREVIMGSCDERTALAG
ncbi:hypothetical protein RRG08_011730 [Elysia crispata]|uniref:Uncharacterized protein n=1 Tax=Elysia crispata TaxID=231223 RepID=A0AAE1AEN5_9GAST|nr:hypothetical protein RRG08_011730 [Elysia crispata]